MPRLARPGVVDIAAYFADCRLLCFRVLSRDGAVQVEIDTLEVIALKGRLDLFEVLVWAAEI
jgi:hypothetical protein